jgi:hypothetical protein
MAANPPPEQSRPMCFSATASFTTSALLLPVGIFTLSRGPAAQRHYLALAAFPLLFGIQQLWEGLLWLGLTGHASIDVHSAALGFLFFVYLVWPPLVPLAAALIEPQPGRKRLFGAMAILGLLLGASLLVPLGTHPGWLDVTVAGNSIHYGILTLYDGRVDILVPRLLYAALILLPMLLASLPGLRRFGMLLLASLLVSALFYQFAFISVWCFFAALLSLQAARVVLQQCSTEKNDRVTDFSGVGDEKITPP